MAVVVWTLALTLAGAYLASRPAAKVAVLHADPAVHERLAETGPGLRSVMVQAWLMQDARAEGPARDAIHVTFDAPACVVGMLVSVDIMGPTLVEVAAGVNTPQYAANSPGWIIHTSDFNEGHGSQIDESVMLPGEGMCLGPGDYVGIVAWLSNDLSWSSGVSPEVIVYYRRP